MSDVRAAWWKRMSGTYAALFLLFVGGFATYRYALRRRYNEEMEQQRLGEVRRNSERLFSAIIEASPVPSAVCNAHGTITYLNASFTKTFGYNQIDIPTLDEWWPKAYPDPVYRQWVATSLQAKLRNAKLSKRAFEPLEVCIRCKDGTDRTVSAAASPLGESREDSHLVTLYDITERKAAETALLKSEQHFRSLFNNAQVGMLRSRPDGSAILDCNDKFLEITGRTREEIIGAPSTIFWAEPRQRQEMVDGLNADGYWADKDLDLLNKKGEVRHCITSLKLFRENDLLEGSVLDITERKQSEDLLRESELRWKFAIEGSGDGVWDWNIQTDRAAYSSRWKEMLGYSDVDILPTNDEWVMRIHPDDQAYVADAMQAYLDRKTAIYVVEYRLRCKDENYKWILGRGMVVSHSDDGKPLRMIGTHTDITERRRMEEALRESDARYKRAVDGASDGIWEFVIETGENYMSPHLKQMLGYEDHELPNVLASYVDLLHPDDAARVMEVRQAHIEQRKPYEMEMRLRCKSGAYRWFYSRGQATWDENGQPLLLSGSISDVTARKKVEAALNANEERFRQAFDRSPTGMLLCELDGVIAKANESFCRMSGYASAGIVGRRLADLSPNTSARNDEIALFRRIACREIADFSVQIELLHKDGHSYVVQNFVSVVRSSEDVPLYCIAQVENQTELKQQQLKALGKQVLVVQEQERSRLSRELHDDVGQSLIALKLMLQRMQNNCSRGQDREPLQQAKVAAERLIGDVRSIAYSLRPSQLDDLGLMSSLRWHLDNVARPAGLESVLSGNLGNARLPEALELCCFRVVQEALTNVLKHARASKLEVGLNRGENKVLLTLRDNGIGFDVTRHYLLPDDSRSLGLIGMRERVAAMGSRLEIESSPGQGTEIRASFVVP
jgi:PAS domain S-box-containing protein